MTYAVESVEDGEYVRVVFTDTTTRTDHERARDEAIQTLGANGWNRLLADARRIDAKMSVMRER